MNMLNNKVAFGFLSEEDKQLFIDCDPSLLEMYVCALDDDWHPIKKGRRVKGLINTITYRLKLIKGMYYKIHYDGCSGVFMFSSYATKMEVGAEYYIEAWIYLSHGGTIHNKYKIYPLDDITIIRPATEAEIEELMAAFEKTIYPKNPLDGFPPIFICPCKSLASLDIKMNREAIEAPSKDGYRNYDMGDINGTIVCTKCKTKLTYNIESHKGG